jgi:hypothetical protein
LSVPNVEYFGNRSYYYEENIAVLRRGIITDCVIRLGDRGMKLIQ